MSGGSDEVSVRAVAEAILTVPVSHALELTTISAVSRSLAELLRLCALRVGLSRGEEAAALVLGNPKAWLGTHTMRLSRRLG